MQNDDQDIRPARRLTLHEDGQIQEVKSAGPRGLSTATVVGWTILGAIIPGMGLIKAGRKRAGAIIVTLFVLTAVGTAAWIVLARSSFLRALLKPTTLTLVTWGLMIGALVWVVLVVASHLYLRGDRPSPRRRLGGALLVGALSFAICAPLAVGARYTQDSSAFLGKVFAKDPRSATKPQEIPDSWENKPRLNLLLLGGDGYPGRPGTRTDTVIVASIDTKTGNTTLIGLPRQTTALPFPKGPLRDAYPNGFTNGNPTDPEYMLTSMYDNVPSNNPGILGETDNPGADAQKLAVGEALGLKIDYYMLVEIRQFSQLIDAFGGVTVNINEYVAMGGNTDKGTPPKKFLTPGPDQHLNGNQAMWFARGRFGADNDQRMDRQRCTINAMVRQLNPQNVLSRYEQITRAGGEMLKTDIPQDLLEPLVTLASRVQQGSMRSLTLKHGVDGFSTTHPNWDEIRARVQATIAASGTQPKPKASTTSAAPKPTKAATPTSTPTPTAKSDDADSAGDDGHPKSAPKGEDADNVCAYNPQKADSARANPPWWAKR